MKRLDYQTRGKLVAMMWALSPVILAGFFVIAIVTAPAVDDKPIVEVNNSGKRR